MASREQEILDALNLDANSVNNNPAASKLVRAYAQLADAHDETTAELAAAQKHVETLTAELAAANAAKD